MKTETVISDSEVESTVVPEKRVIVKKMAKSAVVPDPVVESTVIHKRGRKPDLEHIHVQDALTIFKSKFTDEDYSKLKKNHKKLLKDMLSIFTTDLFLEGKITAATARVLYK